MEGHQTSSSTSNSDIAKFPETKSPSLERPLYSSKFSDQKSRPAPSAASNSATSSTPSQANNRQAAAPPKAWTGAKNPITGRYQPPQTGSAQSNIQDQKVGSQQEDTSSFPRKMVQQKKGPNTADMPNGSSRRDNTSFQRKDSGDARVMANNTGKNEGRSANGSRTGFRTDTGISNSHGLAGRELQRWDAPPDAKNSDKNLSLESSDGPAWDQFAVNEKLFGLKTDYDENIYTTAIDKAHPNYHQRVGFAEQKAREIERSVPVTAHQAEERIMDLAGKEDDGNEEDKYSGVRRNNITPLQSRENKYTPPARRAPTGHTTVKGAPVDPAIISSQLKVSTPKQTAAKADEIKTSTAQSKPSTTPTPESKVTGAKQEAKPDSKSTDSVTTGSKSGQDTNSAASKPSPPSTTPTPRAAAGAKPPTGTTTDTTISIEQNVLTAFKSFATKERMAQDKSLSRKARQDKEVKLHELKKFGADFKLSTPVPQDLIPIIAKDPEKQKAIQEKALRDAQEVAKAKASQEAAAAKQKQPPATKEAPQTKVPTEPTTSTAATPAPAADTRGPSRPAAPQHSSSPSAVPGRNLAPRQQYAPQSHYQQPYNNRDRGNRQNSQFGGQQPPQTGNLGQRIRENRMQQPQHMAQHMPMEMRPPPTGPASFDPPYGGRRLSGLPPSHLQQGRLNPNTMEFKPNATALPFNPSITSQASSPLAPINNVVEPARTPPAPGQLIRRKTKAVDTTKCNILSFLKTLKPPPSLKIGKPHPDAQKYDENLCLRPSYQTPVTWRQLQEQLEKPDSTMHLTYKEFFARQPSSSAAPAVPNPHHVPVSMPHHHQLPLHLQGPGPHMAPRQSPHMASVQMHNGQHGAMQAIPFSGHPDDHRMMHSNSAQSFASPRMASQMPMAYPPNMNSPAQMPYAQPVMQPFLNNGPPAMNPNMRSFSHNPQYGMPQQHAMGHQVMFQPQYMPQNGMGPVAQQVPMYNGAPGQFMPPGTIPAPSVAGSNGFPSPGRPAAPMMAHNGSHQGQPPMMYGVSPNVQYQQPYVPHQPPNKYQGQRP